MTWTIIIMIKNRVLCYYRIVFIEDYLYIVFFFRRFRYYYVGEAIRLLNVLELILFCFGRIARMALRKRYSAELIA